MFENGHVPILNQPKIVISMVPGAALGTFDVQVDTTGFPHGVPLAVQCMLQAAMSLIPEAYRIISEYGGKK